MGGHVVSAFQHLNTNADRGTDPSDCKYVGFMYPLQMIVHRFSQGGNSHALQRVDVTPDGTLTYDVAICDGRSRDLLDHPERTLPVTELVEFLMDHPVLINAIEDAGYPLPDFMRASPLPPPAERRAKATTKWRPQPAAPKDLR